MGLEPLTVEIITYAPTEFFHCTHCEVVFQQVGIGQKVHAEQRQTNLPDELRAELLQLSAWAEQLAECHPGRLRFKLVDAASLEGVWKALRYRLRSFPAVIIDGEEKVVGGLESFSRAVERHLAMQSE